MTITKNVPMTEGVVFYETALTELVLTRSLLFVGYYPDLLIQLNKVRERHGILPMTLSGIRNAALPVAMDNLNVHIEGVHGPMVMTATPELLNRMLKRLKEAHDTDPTLRLANLGEPGRVGGHQPRSTQ